MSFDFVIVGAGAAGCVLAERLSRDPKHKVAILEAGTVVPEELPITTVHDQWFVALHTQNIAWGLVTTPQTGCNGRELHPDVGKMLGGCSSHNAMFYVRGNLADYDSWEKQGCTGINGKAMLQAFKSMEKHEESEYHGSKGFISIRPAPTDDFMNSVKSAAKELNVPWLEDHNAEHQLGVGPIWNNVDKDNQRCGAWQAFLKPSLGRPNLTCLSGSQVHRVLIENGVAVGVEYFKVENATKMLQIRATKEVILSGGALLSPQILLLSGVGPADELAKHGIPLVKELPVGKNLYDHPFAALYVKSKRSLQSSYAWAHCNGFGRCDGSYDKSLAPDYQYCFVGRKEQLPGFPRAEGTENDGTDQFMLAVAVLHPKSVGELTLASKNPLDKPLINPNYLTHPEDIKVILAASKVCREFAEKMTDFTEKQIQPLPNLSEEEETKFWRNQVGSMWHPVGTCRMGSENDPRTVVNPRGKVQGIANLRVADASVMPDLPSGNTHAPTLGVAVLLAEKIMEDHNK